MLWASSMSKRRNLIADTKLIKSGIYLSRDAVQKSYGYATMIPAPGAFNIFTAIDKNIHRFKRKVLSQGFSDQTIRAFEPTMLHHINIFVRKLMRSLNNDDGNDGWSPPYNMTECCRHLQYDVMGEFGFGQSFQLQLKPDNHFLIDAVTATGVKAGVFVQYPRLQYLQLDKLLYRKGLLMREKYLQLMARLVRERLSAEKDSHNDLFSSLIDAKDPETGKGFTESELWAESRFLLIAGADTSSTGLAAAFFYLSAYPACYAKLVSEIRNTFTSGSEIRTGPKLASCRYLRACIDEMMRMSPPISGTLWREVCPGGIDLDNHHIPAGYDIGVNPYAVHHNEELFPNSYTYKPERWIESETNPNEAVERARFAFSPFSLGTRACAGRNMAYMELTDTLAKTVWYTDFQRAEGPLGKVGAGSDGAMEGRHRIGEFQLQEHITCAHDGPFLQFRRRKGLAEDLLES
ncbi:MAG: hypothetical protein M1816_006579 [Peltula sp. TS41687]|nr:MAG: hypothetical protein M1816_006579 [Peltula sp. TS41687]